MLFNLGCTLTNFELILLCFRQWFNALRKQVKLSSKKGFALFVEKILQIPEMKQIQPKIEQKKNI